jgi:hypothetical protein
MLDDIRDVVPCYTRQAYPGDRTKVTLVFGGVLELVLEKPQLLMTDFELNLFASI